MNFEPHEKCQPANFEEIYFFVVYKAALTPSRTTLPWTVDLYIRFFGQLSKDHNQALSIDRN